MTSKNKHMKKVFMLAFAITLLVACRKETINDPANPDTHSGIVSNKDKDNGKEEKETKTKSVKVSGTITGTSILMPSAQCASGFMNIGHGTGQSTPYGKFVFDNSDCLGTPFHTTFTYPNGDKVYTTQVGEFFDPATGFIVQDAVFTGGTGRFAGATGTSRLYITQFLPTATPGVYKVTGNFEGTLIISKDKDD